MGAGALQRRKAELYKASRDGDLAKTKKYLRKGLSPDSLSDVGQVEGEVLGGVVTVDERCKWSVLMAAALKAPNIILVTLLQNKANPRLASAEGLTPLHIAAYKGRVHAVEQLLKAEADPNQTEHERGQNALMLACRGKHTRIASLLIKNKARINANDSIDGMTALLWSLDGPLALVECLLKSKADVKQKNFYGQTPLLYAAQKTFDSKVGTLGDQNKEEKIRSAAPSSVIKILLDAKAQPNAKNYDEYTALIVAAHQGFSSAVQTIIECKANLEARARQGQNALMVSSAAGHSSVVQLLIRSKSSLNHQDEQGQTALIKSILAGHGSVARALLSAKADPNHMDHDGMSGLAHCISSPMKPDIKENCFQTILAYSPSLKINQADHRNRSYLLMAAEKLDVLACRRLVEIKADVNWADDEGNNAVLLSTSLETLNMAKDKYNPPPLAPIIHPGPGPTGIAIGKTEATEATESKKALEPAGQPLSAYLGPKRSVEEIVAQQVEILDVLYEAKANVNHQNHKGLTAIMQACMSVSLVPIIKSLMEKRADPTIQDVVHRRSALDVWKTFGNDKKHPTIQPLLSQPPSPPPSQAGGTLASPDLTRKVSGSTQRSVVSAPQSNRTHKQGLSTGGTSVPGIPVNSGESGGSSTLGEDPTDWGADRVGVWLQGLGLGQYENEFVANAVDGGMLMELASSQDAKRLLTQELGVTKELHRMRLLREMKKLKKAQDIAISRETALMRRRGLPTLTVERTKEASKSDDSNSKKLDEKMMSIAVHRIPFEELKFDSEIGRGAFGIVFLASWRNSVVAIKRLHEQHMTDVRLREFLAEAQMMERIGNHPRVVRFLGVCATPGKPLCIVTEYMPGGAVDKILKSKRALSLRQRLIWAHDGACGVYHLHAERIIHRDIAARNLLLGGNMRVKVSDFGMSRTRTNYTSRSADITKSHVGPVCWMAPESIVHRQYSEKSDVYSFGVLIWELLTRKVPYFSQGLTGLQVVLRAGNLVRHFEQNLPIPSHVPSLHLPNNTPKRMRELFFSCQKTNPKSRPSFQHIVEILSQAVDEEREREEKGRGGGKEIGKEGGELVVGRAIVGDSQVPRVYHEKLKDQTKAAEIDFVDTSKASLLDVIHGQVNNSPERVESPETGSDSDLYKELALRNRTVDS
ncbi:hypothetical protein AAMO2058_000385800 [Amorphochlora amoebiformis]